MAKHRGADVIIIGGGVIGLSLAWRLSRQGGRVTLLERGEVGKESSRAAAGMLLPFGETQARDPFFSLCLASLKRYPAFVRELEDLTGMRVDHLASGALYPVLGDESRERLLRRFGWQKEFGLSHEALGRRQIRARYPGLSPDIETAYFVRNDQQVDNRKLLSALFVACEIGAVSVEENQEVKEILVRRGRAAGVKTASGYFEAPWIINAAGAWSSRIPSPFPNAAARVKVSPIRGQRITLDPTERSRRFHPKTIIFSHGCYLVPRQDGTMILGATEEEDGYSKRVTPEGVSGLLARALKLFPALRYFTLRHIECGLRPATADRKPLLGPTPLKGYVMATGHYRNGILLAPITAQAVSELVLTRSLPAVLKAFQPSRVQVA